MEKDFYKSALKPPKTTSLHHFKPRYFPLEYTSYFNPYRCQKIANTTCFAVLLIYNFRLYNTDF